MSKPFDFDKNPAMTQDYERGPRAGVPGYEASHAMAATLLADRIGDRGRVLGAALNRNLVRLTVVAVAVLGGGCYPKVGPAPGALSADTVARAPTRWPGATAATLSKGRDRFLATCNGCHGYPDLAAIGDDRWPRIVERMAAKADLNADDRAAVLHFILASRVERTGS